VANTLLHHGLLIADSVGKRFPNAGEMCIHDQTLPVADERSSHTGIHTCLANAEPKNGTTSGVQAVLHESNERGPPSSDEMNELLPMEEQPTSSVS
jgi:hypothetical protein